MAEESKETEYKVVVRTDRHTRRLKATGWAFDEIEGVLYVATKTHGYYFPLDTLREFRRPHIDQEG